MSLEPQTPDSAAEDDSAQILNAALAVADAAAKPLVPLIVAAALRKLSDLMTEAGWEDGNEWPDPDDLQSLADTLEGYDA